tara:strand:+ start:236 stop:532 length:297 start_codon:yes stop_codon:yes gene_type:complete
MKPNNKVDAIIALVGTKITSKADGTIVYHDGQTPPTEKEIEDKLKELQDDYDAKQYQRDRQPEYPQIGDQLDALYHAGVFPKEMADIIKATKDKYPKG